jgi:predicted nucleic acid-binding protein
MPRTIISDTSCLIVLSKINELELLYKVYGQIITTPEIAQEFGLHYLPGLLFQK